VAFGAELNPASALESSTQNRASEHGIIIVSGHDAVSGLSGSFWDQAASATHADIPASTQVATVGTAAGLANAVHSTETNGTHVAALDSSTHTATLEIAVAHESGFASASFGHSELGSTALHDLTSLGSGAFATHMHL